MLRYIKHNPLRASRTAAEEGHFTKLKYLGQAIVCNRCGKAGGTLVKIGNGVYQHDQCK